MTEWLILSMCIMSDLKQNGCGMAVSAYEKTDTELHMIEKNLTSQYVTSLPEDLKIVAGTAGVLYNKRLKVSLYKGLFIDLRGNDNRMGYEYHF
jgi:hypothetical protein